MVVVVRGDECVRACVRACVRVCVCVCVFTCKNVLHKLTQLFNYGAMRTAAAAKTGLCVLTLRIRPINR